MALSYSQLVNTKATDGSLKNWLNYAQLPSAAILVLAEAYIYERLRAREMRTTATVSISDGVDSYAVPTGFLDPIKLQLDGDGGPLDYVHENLLERIVDEDGNLEEGTISAYTIIDETFLFDVKSSEDREGDVWFYKTPDALSTSNETNFLTARYPALLLDACMAFGYGFRKMFGQRNELLALVSDSIDKANVAESMSRRGQLLR